MKIAIFHNFMDNIGGAEIFSLTLARELSADIFTTNIDRDKIAKMGFRDIKIISIGSIPINAPLKQQLAQIKFRRLNLGRQYDFYLICGDWAMSGAVNNHPNLWYVQSPIREIWDLYKYTRNNTVPFLLRPIFDLWVYYNRFLNKKYLRSVDTLIANSHNVAVRIKKYFGRTADVIHPPVDCKKFCNQKGGIPSPATLFPSSVIPAQAGIQNIPSKLSNSNLDSRLRGNDTEGRGGYWLSVNRLIGHKRIELQMEAFARLPNEKLIMVGSYEQSKHFLKYSQHIQNTKPANVEIKSWVDQDKLIDLYANCTGFITTAHEEDFGLTPLEAMASGKPVIAPNEGGYRETVIDGITGKLIDNIDTDKLIQAIKQISSHPEHFRSACLAQAQKFDTAVFIKKIKDLIGVK